MCKTTGKHALDTNPRRYAASGLGLCASGTCLLALLLRR